jgi:hypothetical protein
MEVGGGLEVLGVCLGIAGSLRDFCKEGVDAGLELLVGGTLGVVEAGGLLAGGTNFGVVVVVARGDARAGIEPAEEVRVPRGDGKGFVGGVRGEGEDVEVLAVVARGDGVALTGALGDEYIVGLLADEGEARE